MEKKKRNVNFNKAEEELLVELIRKRKKVLENKQTDAVMWKELAWLQVERDFNANALLVPRSVEQLKLKWKNRSKEECHSCEVRKTGGGSDESQPLNPVDEKIKDLIRLSADGLLSYVDCDIEVPFTESEIASLDVVLTEDPDEDCFSDAEGQTTQGRNEEGADHGSSLQRDWTKVTPQQLKQRKSSPLRSDSNKKQRRSLSAEAKAVLQRKDEIFNLQKKCLEQEVEMNEERKRNLVLDNEVKSLMLEKMKLEIKLLQKQVEESK